MVCQTRVTIEGRCHRCTHGEWRVDSYNVLFYTVMSRWIKEIECIVLSIKRI
jgi:hypothetical protein